MGGSPSGVGQLGSVGGTQGNFNWADLFGGGGNDNASGNYKSPLNPAQAAQRNQQDGVGSLDWMKWHPDYQPTVGTAAWGATHPDPAQGVKYGSAQWQQTHPNYQANQMIPAQLGQPPNDLSEVIKHMFGGGQ
jgi:hypothetical protein